MAAKKPGESNSFRAIGESDRTPEFKAARSKFVEAVDEAFDTLEQLKESPDKSLKYGSAVFGMLGITREVIPNPLGGFSLIQESAKSHPGIYVATDPSDGQDVITMRRPDRSFVEIRRNSLVKSIVVTDDPEGSWNAPVANSGHETVVSVRETQPDGGSIGFEVTAAGSVQRHVTEPGRNGLNSTRAMMPHDHEGIEPALTLLQMARDDFFTDHNNHG